MAKVEPRHLNEAKAVIDSPLYDGAESIAEALAKAEEKWKHRAELLADALNAYRDWCSECQHSCEGDKPCCPDCPACNEWFDYCKHLEGLKET